MADYPRKIPRRLLMGVTLCYTAALSFASPRTVSPESVLAATAIRRTINNFLHVPAYALRTLMFCVLFHVCDTKLIIRGSLVCGATATIVFGGLMELAQAFIPGRTCSLGDLFLNSTGVCAGVVSMWKWSSVKQVMKGPRPKENGQDR